MDKKDYQLLELMAQNCRIPNNVLGEALRISKDSVARRISKLEKEEMLNQYVLFIDARKLGFTRYHLLIHFDSDLENESEVTNKLSEHPNVMWINTFIGRFDMQIIVDATDGFELNKVREELFAICENKVKEYNILTHVSDLEFTQLNPVIYLGTKFQKKNDFSFSLTCTTKKFPVDKEFKKYNLSSLENEVLHVLSRNPKESLIDIGKKVKADRTTVKKKISSLIDNKVILNFGGIPNLSKLGFVTYYLLVRLEQNTTLEELKKPFEELNNIFYAGKMLGDYDMILYLNARNPNELNESINLFKKHIEKKIIHYELLVQDKVHHWKQFTEAIYKHWKK